LLADTVVYGDDDDDDDEKSGSWRGETRQHDTSMAVDKYYGRGSCGS